MTTPETEVEDDATPDGPGRMSFLDHLDELRRRILYSVYSVLAAAVLSFSVIRRVLDEVTFPMLQEVSSGKLLGTEALDPIMFFFKAGLFLALIIAAPLILLQVWYFIAPGLYSKEKRLAVPFVFFSSLLFFAGAYFGHQYAFRITWKFLADFSRQVVSFMEWTPTVGSAFSLYLRIVLGMGVIFQMPVVIFVLARFGLVTARFLLKNFKYAVLIIFIVAAVASPGQDPASQLLFAAPMLVLYVLSIGVAWVFGKKKPKDEEPDETP